MSELGLFRDRPQVPYRGPYEIDISYHDYRTQIVAKSEFNSFTIIIEHHDEPVFVEPTEIDDDGIRGGIAEISVVFEGRLEAFNYFYMLGDNPERAFDFGEFVTAQLASSFIGPSLFAELTALVRDEMKRIMRNPLPPPTITS